MVKDVGRVTGSQASPGAAEASPPIGFDPARRHEMAAKLAVALMDMPPETLWAVGDMEEGAFARLCWPMPDGSYLGGYVEAHALTVDRALRMAIEKGKAIATEAGTAATVKQGAVHEGAGRKASPNNSGDRDHD